MPLARSMALIKVLYMLSFRKVLWTEKHRNRQFMI